MLLFSIVFLLFDFALILIPFLFMLALICCDVWFLFGMIYEWLIVDWIVDYGSLLFEALASLIKVGRCSTGMIDKVSST